MQPDSEDEAWRSIVENYGERAEIGPDQAPEPVPEPVRRGTDADPEPVEDEDRFVPPPPPPLPHPTPDRLAAWSGVLGAPTVLLVALLAGVHLSPLVGYALVVAFVGGFVYLVARMPRGPRDPGDDGARL